MKVSERYTLTTNNTSSTTKRSWFSRILSVKSTQDDQKGYLIVTLGTKTAWIPTQTKTPLFTWGWTNIIDNEGKNVWYSNISAIARLKLAGFNKEERIPLQQTKQLDYDTIEKEMNRKLNKKEIEIHVKTIMKGMEDSNYKFDCPDHQIAYIASRFNQWIENGYTTKNRINDQFLLECFSKNTKGKYEYHMGHALAFEKRLATDAANLKKIKEEAKINLDKMEIESHVKTLISEMKEKNEEVYNEYEFSDVVIASVANKLNEWVQNGYINKDQIDIYSIICFFSKINNKCTYDKLLILYKDLYFAKEFNFKEKEIEIKLKIILHEMAQQIDKGDFKYRYNPNDFVIIANKFKDWIDNDLLLEENINLNLLLDCLSSITTTDEYPNTTKFTYDETKVQALENKLINEKIGRTQRSA